MEKRIEDLKEENRRIKTYEDACNHIEHVIRWEVLGPLWLALRHIEGINDAGEYENDLESVRLTLENIHRKLKDFVNKE